MERGLRIVAIGLLATATMLALGFGSAVSQPRPHVYLFRGLADIFSTGMDTLAEELNKRGVTATSHSHTDWKAIADGAAAAYKAKKEGPIIIIGHSLGADAAMEMADYLGDKGVVVALIVPFDGTQSLLPVPANVARVTNFTQRDYAYIRPGPGFRGSINNIDLSSDSELGHLNIDKSPALHARVIEEVLAVIGGRRATVHAPTDASKTKAATPAVSTAPASTGPGAAAKSAN
jgi:alpha-beta hydrolase superfamily lysophospholipase